VRRLADQLIELGDRFADLRPEFIVAPGAGFALGQRPLDPLQRALRTVKCSGKCSVIHSPCSLRSFPIPGKGMSLPAPRFVERSIGGSAPSFALLLALHPAGAMSRLATSG
jgi:hypothetical protein